MTINIAPGLELPVDMVTEPIGVLANRGRGKSYTTHVLVEEIHNAGEPVVILDVKGDWWGLRSSADGKAAGLPFYVFGGDHADVPLEHTAGEVIADLVVEQRVSVVIDMSALSKTKARSFTTTFAERLYARNRDPLFLVVDEADVLIPQRASAETARLLGAMEDIAKRGRGRGLGIAVVTQRPQEVAKSVLDLMDTLIVLGMTGPRSLKSVREWISAHVDEDTTNDEVMASLPALPVGTAWVWSPMLHLLRKVQVRRMATFDSHVTPKPGQRRKTPTTRVELDLDALGEQIAATVERAKADDPRALRATIARLERDLEAAHASAAEQTEPETVIEHVAVNVVPTETLEVFSESAGRLLDVLATIEGRLQEYPHELPTEGKQGQPTTRRSAPRATPTSSTTGRAPVAGSSTHRGKDPSAGRETRPTPADGPLSKMQEKILSVLVHGDRTQGTAATLAGYKLSGSWRNNLSNLRTRGYIEGSAVLSITDAGRDALGPVDPMPLGPELRDYWKAHASVPAMAGAMLDVLAEAYPEGLTPQEIAERTGYQMSGSFRNALSRLRSIGLAHGTHGSPVLIDEVLM